MFIDEIHRFNRAQQDALLPAVEDGSITLIGATTENPSFEVNAPLLSRSLLHRLQALDDEAVAAVIERGAVAPPTVCPAPSSPTRPARCWSPPPTATRGSR